MVVTVGVNVSAASVAVRATSVRCDRQGQPCRRRSAMSMRSGGRAEPASPGTALSHAGGVWSGLRERSMAWAGGCKAGSNSVSRKWVEQLRAPWCCQPWHLSPGSGRSHCAGRRSLCTSCQEGRRMAPASARPASSAARKQAAAAAGPVQRVLRGTWQQRQGGARVRRAVRRPRRPSKLQGRYARRTAGPGHPNEPAAHWASHITA